jgi:protein-S-isoprenylcysteine O-methyltransferase Ste14
MRLPPVFNYPEAALFWIVFICFFYLEIQLTRTIARNPFNKQDAGTRLLIKIGNGIAFFLALFLSFLPLFVIPSQRIFLNAGIAILIIGSLFRQYSIRILGKYFTPEVIVDTNQPVIESGPYRWIRHPGYSGAFLMFLGIGLAFGSWLSLIVFFLEAFFVYSRRVKAEEKAMLETIGEPYRVYLARTKRFIPFIF